MFSSSERQIMHLSIFELFLEGKDGGNAEELTLYIPKNGCHTGRYDQRTRQRQDSPGLELSALGQRRYRLQLKVKPIYRAILIL
jgi:hypothetical protein